MVSITQVGLYGGPETKQTFAAKTPADYPALGFLVDEFDIWREGYEGAIVRIYKAGTTELMPIYSDIFLTQELTNPQTLIEKTDSGSMYGKFLQSIYVPYPYELDIDNVETTGIQRVPLTTLDGENASNSYAKASGGSTNRNLNDRFADVIHVEDYGTIGTSAATNNTTITAAISAAAAQGGGRVILPAGSIPFNSLTLPADVQLVGQGNDVTVLQSTTAANVITVSGDGAGLHELMLDGVQVNSGSVGLYGVSIDNFKISNVILKRFATGVKWQGGRNHIYRDFQVLNCGYNFRGLGDLNTTGSSAGDEFSGLDWLGGKVAESTIVGVELSVIDKPVRHNSIHQVDFVDNIGADSALLIYGASQTYARQCYWSGNTDNMNVSDNTDTSIESRLVQGLYFEGGEIEGGVNKFDGECQDIIFNMMELNTCEFQLNVPENQILVRDCVESGTSITGDTVQLSRWRTTDRGTVRGTTTDATATQVFKRYIQPNEVVLAMVRATAETLNGTDYAVLCEIQGVRAAPATIDYDEQTANFTVGDTITGATSGATAVVVADSDSGTTGTLSLGQIIGTFVNDEIITGATSGSARVNGMLVEGAVSLIGAKDTLHTAGSNSGAVPTGWTTGFAVNGQELQVTVKGGASKTVFWNVTIDLVAA